MVSDFVCIGDMLAGVENMVDRLLQYVEDVIVIKCRGGEGGGACEGSGNTNTIHVPCNIRTILRMARFLQTVLLHG